MKVGVYSPYLDTLGGGERYVLSVAKFFLNCGYETDLFVNTPFDLKKIKDRFGIDLQNISFAENIFNYSFLQKVIKTAEYDLIFFLSDGSIPASFAKKNILHFQTPFGNKNYKTFFNFIKLRKINKVVCNSKFTKKYIDNSYGVNSDVLYPPVDTEIFVPKNKKNIILSVGRFFAPSHPKKQEIMLDVFSKMLSNGVKDWSLVLLGGVTGDSKDSVNNLRSKYKSSSIEILTDVTLPTLKKYYGETKIYWHAAGYGEDIDTYPEKAEHFGISTVEAMSAGAVPVVFKGGGQIEIITNDQNGFLWQTIDELKIQTLKLIDNEDLRIEMSNNAIKSSKPYSLDNFFNKLKTICET